MSTFDYRTRDASDYCPHCGFTFHVTCECRDELISDDNREEAMLLAVEKCNSFLRRKGVPEDRMLRLSGNGSRNTEEPDQSTLMDA